VVAITTVAQHTGHMRSSTAAALVGAAIISTLVFPLVGLRLRRDRVAAEQGTAGVDGPAADVESLQRAAPAAS
jgi:hypothetical protein